MLTVLISFLERSDLAASSETLEVPLIITEAAYAPGLSSLGSLNAVSVNMSLPSINLPSKRL
ncbi:MAG: hypothetical protein CL862_03735 [Cyanobium sp. NAT70]|nr:hypothetical protein [Cyanobium sp. NAT70]